MNRNEIYQLNAIATGRSFGITPRKPGSAIGHADANQTVKSREALTLSLFLEKIGDKMMTLLCSDRPPLQPRSSTVIAALPYQNVPPPSALTAALSGDGEVGIATAQQGHAKTSTLLIEKMIASQHDAFAMPTHVLVRAEQGPPPPEEQPPSPQTIATTFGSGVLAGDVRKLLIR